MWESIIAVVGTLAGAGLTGLLAQRAARAERAETRAAANRTEQLAAVRDLAVALADHRRIMWKREDLRLHGDRPDAYEAAREASHATRAAITAPQVTVSVLVPALAPLADAAARASYAMRGAADPQALEQARAAAVTAADDFVKAAGLALTA